MARPSMNDIALRLGISKMTVSRALRGGKHVEAELRGRILGVAEELGYRPDPEIAKLMTHMRRTRRTAEPQTLAFVWAERSSREMERSSWSQQLVLGAHRQAEKLGFRLEEFHLSARGMTGRRLSDILEARGIPGFILSPLVSRSRGHVSMAWEKFSSVVIGLGYARPQLHRVHHHHYLGMMTALRMLKKQGCKRIGFYCGSTINERMFRAWSASFLAHHPLAKPGELLALRKVMSRGDFQEWLRGAKPEVVIDGGHLVKEWLEEVPASRRPLHVSLGWRADMPEVAGVDQQADVLGAAAVDLLVTQYQQNERGIPDSPRIVMTEGRWRSAGERPPISKGGGKG
ncbi:LacI family DNA-binding transcriptional regulator [Prosthecobacter vanneervenii]|uniref:Transcriptional regulator with XRE-family HTH domain n=1 Tax=Prosthecobacter vanneervenii TaxID=48466 RepID=A0A7W8DJG7_9BACT|nr:LacI family DNA-binding transcriptional regulator [Prosthecobacter vanneervenii]MBB5032133.1 transcriptional regulator with XRE-family HTH domain [Prosthecobacter vanneervenii]